MKLNLTKILQNSCEMTRVGKKIVKILFIRWKLPKNNDFSLRLSVVYDIIIQDVKQRVYKIFQKILQSNERRRKK